MNCLKLDTRRFFVFGLRIFFGIWLLYVGLSKWVMFGPAGFIALITEQFDPTWSPHALNVALAMLIMIAEPVLALLLLSGIMPRAVWALTALFMFMLTFGQTMLMPQDVSGNWQYLVLALVAAALSQPIPRASKSSSGAP